MTKQEAAKLLSLIKLSYPTAYRDIDRQTANATVAMWAGSFPDVPYPIMEQAFNRFRMVSKFPPTVAELAFQLKQLHYQAMELALIHQSMGNGEELARCYRVMEVTAGYKDLNDFWSCLQGGTHVQRFGASGDRMGIADGVSVLDAGEGGANR